MRFHYTVQTYTELRQWAHKFAKDPQLHSLVVFGSAGVGKSETFMRALVDEYVIPIKGRLSAFQLYRLIAQYPDALFLLDDTRRILKDFECVNLLMALSEHTTPKIVQWNTSTLVKRQVDDDADHNPNKVVTRSRIAIIVNRFDEGNEDLEPLISRSIVIQFAPSKEEVHRYVGEWFPQGDREREIYEYIGSKLGMIPVADVRDYTKSLTVYNMKWKERLHESWTGDEYMTAALQVINDLSIPLGKAQVQKFFELCGGSRAQFFRLKRVLMPLRNDPVSQSHHPHVLGSRAKKGFRRPIR